MPESNAVRRKRYATNPEYRDRRISRATAWYQALPVEDRRRRSRKWKLAEYGLTQEGYDALLAAQGGVCAICKQPEVVRINLSVDHCHATGKVRGLLCNGCNPGLGNFQDSPVRLRAAADYLEKETR